MSTLKSTFLDKTIWCTSRWFILAQRTQQHDISTDKYALSIASISRGVTPIIKPCSQPTIGNTVRVEKNVIIFRWTFAGLYACMLGITNFLVMLNIWGYWYLNQLNLYAFISWNKSFLGHFWCQSFLRAHYEDGRI